MKLNILTKLGNYENGKLETNSAKTLSNIQKELLKNRGLITTKQQQEFLKPSLKQLDREFFDKKQLEKAILRIKQAIENKELIIVYSDYDADGITGGAVLWETLRSLGAEVLPYVPQRVSEGYGLSVIGIDKIIKEHKGAKLIITVDCGITAVEQTAYAYTKGIDVIITDHHLKDKIIPKAYAMIHTTELSGSGVAYVFSKEIVNGNPKGFRTLRVEQADDHLALVAIGTISDLVPLTGANRVIAVYGLKLLQDIKRPGLNALCKEAGLEGKPIGTYEVGFLIGPRINASGRLKSALDALRLLCTKDQKRAEDLAKELNETNRDRQELLEQTVIHAKEQVDSSQKLLFIAHTSYHEGVIGLVASRLVEEFYRPAIVLSKNKKHTKASARSVKGYNIIEAIRSQVGLLVNAGGHPMAAGFTVETEKLLLLQKELTDHVNKTLDDSLLERSLRVDMEIPLSFVTKELYDVVSQFAPFGVGNPDPTFVSRGVSIVDARTVGQDGKHLKLTLNQISKSANQQISKNHHSEISLSRHPEFISGSVSISAIAFNLGHLYSTLSPDKPVDIVYSISLNTWNGNERVEIKVRDII